jgi:ELWxxDGT repeat protein
VPERLVFGVSGDFQGSSVWGSDGTPEGTLQIDSGIVLGVAGERALYIAATSSPNNGALMVTDGTPAGTARLLPDLLSQRWESGATANSDGRLFFTGWQDGIYMLMVSNGTTAGTSALAPLHGSAHDIEAGDGRLFFAQERASSDEALVELWTSDGTAAGTRLVRSFELGPALLWIAHLMLSDGTLFFAKGDDAHGRELWTSDGTAGGTARRLDLNPGPAASWPLGPGQAASLGGRLIFAADDGFHGRELWSLAAGGCDLGVYLPLAAR